MYIVLYFHVKEVPASRFLLILLVVVLVVVVVVINYGQLECSHLQYWPNKK